MKRSSAAAPLSENAGIAFAGARVPPGCIVGEAAAQRMLAVRNRHGKPNADVLRPYIDAADFRDPAAAGRRWVVDFPADLTPEEASLYEEPWAVFAEAGGLLRERADLLRIAIARMDSFLAAPAGRVPRGFRRIAAPALPGAGLVVVASDDDFVGAVLQSGVFAAWVMAHGPGVPGLRVHHVDSFPFPWAPRSELGSLSRARLESRDAVIRAAGAGSDAAVASAYGWKGDIEDDEIAARLRALNASRPAAARAAPQPQTQ